MHALASKHIAVNEVLAEVQARCGGACMYLAWEQYHSQVVPQLGPHSRRKVCLNNAQQVHD
jgi:hypothetical protein